MLKYIEFARVRARIKEIKKMVHKVRHFFVSLYRSCRASQQSRSNYRFFPAIRNLNQFGPMDFEK